MTGLSHLLYWATEKQNHAHGTPKVQARIATSAKRWKYQAERKNEVIFYNGISMLLFEFPGILTGLRRL